MWSAKWREALRLQLVGFTKGRRKGAARRSPCEVSVSCMSSFVLDSRRRSQGRARTSVICAIRPIARILMQRLHWARDALVPVAESWVVDALDDCDIEKAQELENVAERIPTIMQGQLKRVAPKTDLRLRPPQMGIW